MNEELKEGDEYRGGENERIINIELKMFFVKVFDENGKKIAELDTLQKVKLIVYTEVLPNEKQGN